MRRSKLAGMLGVVMLLSMAVASPVAATHVNPVEYPGNPKCSGEETPAGAVLGFDHGVKVDPPEEGTFDVGNGTVTVDITSPGVFTWTSSGVTILAVIVKGGPNANVYFYNPPATTTDAGLHPPQGFSHIEFCYNDVPPGSLRIVKDIEGGPGEVSGSFDITVDCGDAGTFEETIEFPDPGEVTIDDLPAGAECTVTEIIQEDPPLGFFWGPPTIVGSPATIVAGQTVTIEITNNLVHKVGDLRIVKDISGGPGEVSGSFDITVDCGNAGTFEETIEFPDPGEVTIENIHTGAECTVTEIIQEDPPLGYHWGPPTIVGSPATIVGGETVTIEITNNLELKPGALRVNKIVEGGPEDFSGSFDITVDCGEQEFSGTIEFPEPGFLTFNGIAIDAECTVTEVSMPEPPEGYEWGDVTYDNNPATVPGGQITEIDITNTLEEKQNPPAPTLTIEKSNDASDPADAGDLVLYTLDYDFTGESAEDGVIEDVLPVGVTYVTDSATDSANDEFDFVGYDATTRTLRWEAEEVTEDGSVTYKVTIDADAAEEPQPLVNHARIDSEDTEPDTAESDVNVAPPPLAETAPPTDVAGNADSAAPGSSILLVLLALAGIVLAVVFVAPTPASVRRRLDR